MRRRWPRSTPSRWGGVRRVAGARRPGGRGVRHPRSTRRSRAAGVGLRRRPRAGAAVPARRRDPPDPRGRQERLRRKADGPEGRRMRRPGRAAAARGLRLGVNHNFLFLPSYEALRREAADGTLGALDHVTVNWLYALGLIQFGPTTTGSSAPKATCCSSSARISPRSSSTCSARSTRSPRWRRTRSSCRAGSASIATGTRSAGSGGTSVSLNLSVAPGQPDRSVHVRGSAAVARLDFERDIYWREQRAATARCSIRCTRRARGAPDRPAGLAQRRPPAGRDVRADAAQRPPSRTASRTASRRSTDLRRSARSAPRRQLRRRGHPPVRAHRRRRGG